MKYRLTVLILSFLLVVSSTVTLTLGWLSKYKPISPDLSFAAGSPGTFYLYRITYADDDEGATRTVYENQTMVGESGFNIRNLQFGKISNLSYLENSNYIYFAIKVPKSEGASVSIGISYYDYENDGDHFKIYVPMKSNGEIVYESDGVTMQTVLLTDATKLANIAAIETDNSATFIRYRYAISPTDPYGYDINAMNALFESSGSETKQMNRFDDNGDPATDSSTFDISSLTSDSYYVYIKLEPNINLYKHFIDYLWDNMPFCLAYEIRVTMSVSV